jgi:imidazolonepropionase-like amidohydrolase
MRVSFMIALRNGTVVDADGVREADVGLDGDEIVAVGSVDEVDEEIDLDGAYVVPGLIDSHVHLMMDGRPDPMATVRESKTMLAYRAAKNLQDALSAGVTTVRDLGAPASLAIDAGAAVDEGVLDGPRVVACGESVVMTGGHGHWFGREADGADEVTKAVREQLKRGADVIKCMATGGVLTQGAVTGAPELSEAEITALVEAASAKGVPTAAHAHGVEGIKNATRAGISSIEHGTFMDREAAEMMAERGTYWVPTAKAVHGIVDSGIQAGIPEWAVEKGEEAAQAFASSFEYAVDEGVSIAMGTDAGTPFNFHGDIPEELELLVDYGLSPEQALRAATVNAASLLGLSDVGRVSRGYRADVVVLGENPLDDVTAWQEPRSVFAAGTQVI